MRQRILSSRGVVRYFDALRYKPRMLTRDDIRFLVDKHGGKQAVLAAAAGVSQPTVSRWLKGAIPDPQQEAVLRRLLVDAGWREAADPARQAFLDKDLPVYAAVEGGPGEMVISTDRIETVPRPWYLGQVREGYAVIVVGESMSPAYEPGDMAIVNPRLPPVRGKTHIFTKGRDDGEFVASIKRLVSQSSTEWLVQQFNPPLEFSLLKAEWPKALRVVGKYEG